MPARVPIFESLLNYLVENPVYIVLGFALYVLVWGISVLFSKPKPGKNPFLFDTARKPAPLVTDHGARDKVLKQGFSMKKIPDNLDVIVIGSGMGGLTVAAILAKAGKKVLVLEQHDQAGGCCHTFLDKGYEFDVGIHYIGQMTGNQFSHVFLKQISDGQIEWVKLEDEIDTVSLGEPGKARKYPIMTGSRDALRDGIIDKFPEEKEAIEKFFRYVRAANKSFIGLTIVKALSKKLVTFLIKTGLIRFVTSFFNYASRTTQEVLDEVTTNEELKAVLAYSYGDYGTEPRSGSFAQHAVLLCHYSHGGYYPRGGASEIAFHMIPVIERAGGRVFVRAPVSEILFNEKGKANGVRVHKTSGDIDVFAPLIISDAGVVNTLTSLVPKDIAVKSPMYKLLTTKTVQSGVGAFSLFVGLKGTTEELGLKANNVWAFTGTNLSELQERYMSLSAEEAASRDIPLLFISFPSTKDPTWEERYPGRSVCTVVTLAKWDWFKEWKDKQVLKRGDDYESLKGSFASRMWDQVCGHFPQLKDKDDYMSLGTPVSNTHYIGSPKGEIYGIDHTVKRFSPDAAMTMRPDTGIRGLKLTGQDVLCCGFSGAMYGGLLCAADVLHRNLLKDLMSLKKQIDKRSKKNN